MDKEYRLAQACVFDAELECNCTCPTMLHNHCSQKWELAVLRALVTCILVVPLKAILLRHEPFLQRPMAQVVC